MKRAFLVVIVVLAGVGCSDSGDGASGAPVTAPSDQQSSTTTPSNGDSTTDPVVRAADCGARPEGSSPAAFDAEVGTYAAQSVALDPTLTALSFNVVQWLSGEDARQRWIEDHPEEPGGPPNDYYIADENDQVRTAPVAPDATVLLTHLATDATPTVEPDTLSGLRTYTDTGDLSVATYWLTFSDGTITDICEQYRP